MRTIWNGSISFGLVNIPIGLALATQRSDIAFRTLHRECGTPIKQKRYCPLHERDVEADELVKGWEIAKGEYVIVEEADLEAVALQRSQSIEILRFVALDEVDPVYFDRTYYLAPADAAAARRPYVLLLRAMHETGMAAIGKFVLWGKENLCLIRPHGDALALETLFFAEDVRSRAEIEEAVEETQVKKPELELARQVIASLEGEFDPTEFENEYRRDLRAMLEAKLAGEEVKRPEPVPETPVVDLMEALKRSVADVQERRPAGAWRGRACQTWVVATGFKGPAPLWCSSRRRIIAAGDGRNGGAAGGLRGALDDVPRSACSLLRGRRGPSARARPRARRRRVELGRARACAHPDAPSPCRRPAWARRLVSASRGRELDPLRRRRRVGRRAGADGARGLRRPLAGRARRAAAG